MQQLGVIHVDMLECEDISFHYPPTRPQYLEMAIDDISMAIGGCYGEISMLVGVMDSAACRHDLAYFMGTVFDSHCRLLGLDSKFMLKKILDKNLLVKRVRKYDSYHKTMDQHDEIREKYATGHYTKKKLSLEYGLCAHFMTKVLNGVVPIVHPPKYIAHGEEMASLRAQNMPWRHIALKFGCDVHQVKKSIRMLDK